MLHGHDDNHVGHRKLLLHDDKFMIATGRTMQYATANREHRLMPPATQILCERCRVSVPTDNLDMKDRCKDPNCSLVNANDKPPPTDHSAVKFRELEAPQCAD